MLTVWANHRQLCKSFQNFVQTAKKNAWRRHQSIRPSVCQWHNVSSCIFMKFIVQVLYRKLTNKLGFHEHWLSDSQLSWGHKWNSAHSCCICWSVWGKFDVEDLNIMPLSSCECCKIWHRASHTLLMGVLEKAVFISDFVPDLFCM